MKSTRKRVFYTAPQIKSVGQIESEGVILSASIIPDNQKVEIDEQGGRGEKELIYHTWE